MRTVKDLVIKRTAKALGFRENAIRRPTRHGETKGPPEVIISNREGAYVMSGAKSIFAGKLAPLQARASPLRGRSIEVASRSFWCLGIDYRVSATATLRRVRRKVINTKGGV